MRCMRQRMAYLLKGFGRTTKELTGRNIPINMLAHLTEFVPMFGGNEIKAA